MCFCMQVPVVSVDRNKMIAIRTTSGSPEEVTKLLPGDNGFAYAIFPSDGARHETDVANLFFSIASKAAQKPKFQAKGKGSAKGKSKAKGKAPPPSSSSESSEEEKGEWDEEVHPTDEDGDEVDVSEAPAEPASTAAAPPAAAPALEMEEVQPPDDAHEAEESPRKKSKQEIFFDFIETL